MLTFGPIPSRRLGYSLGINHIPPKNCTYTCVYCQVGRTTNLSKQRRRFYRVEDVIAEVAEKIEQCHQSGLQIDTLSLVPDGEPTLDLSLAELLSALRGFGIRLAVISNASLIDQPDVRQALMNADWVSLKVDAVTEAVWRKVDRPNRYLSLPLILEGIKTFRVQFKGEMLTETMLVKGINDAEDDISALSDYLLELKPDKAYLAIPTRPPSESWVNMPELSQLTKILRVMADKKVDFLELLFEPEKLDFATSGNLSEAILSITAVHPLREDALRQILEKTGQNWQLVQSLLDEGKLHKTIYRGETFFKRVYK